VGLLRFFDILPYGGGDWNKSGPISSADARRGGPCAGKIHPISLVLRKETGWSPKERRFRCNLAVAQTPQSDNSPHRRPRTGAYAPALTCGKLKGRTRA